MYGPEPGLGVVTEVRGPDVQGRLLGRLDSGRPGPVLICIAGIHGNEPAGVHAVRRVLAALRERESEMKGAFVAFAGNVAALDRGRRFVDRDLNRAWTPERLEVLRAAKAGTGSAEDREQIELLEEIEGVLRGSNGPVYALDLHTTSGPGGIFSVFTDSIPHRDFAQRFPIPMIFGLEELVDGTLINMLSDHGLIAVTVETGQHEEPAAVDRAEAALWIALVAAGLLPERLVPEATEGRKLLRRDSGYLPRALEMRYRRHVEADDAFSMNAGYRNFQAVRAGEVVAHDVKGDVVLTEGGRMLMPLYQAQGDDGFFLVREFSPFWMAASRIMRAAGLARAAVWLPGIRRAGGTDDEVIVDRRVARFFARQLFHLLGFRQMEEVGEHVVMRRRPFDQGRYLREPPMPRSISARRAHAGDDAESPNGAEDSSSDSSAPRGD